MKPFRIGVIGLGFGRFHANVFAAMPDIEVVAVADRTGRGLGVPLEEYCARMGARWYAEGADLIAEADLDAVSICTPPSTHRALVEQAAARGLQVLVEKPMATTVDECDAMIAACAEAGVLCYVEYPMRHLPAVRTARALVDGPLDRPLLASADYVMGPVSEGRWIWDPDVGGGPLNENTTHVIDTLRYLMGEVAEVSALAANLRGRGAPTPDCAAFSLRFDSGALAAVTGGAVGNHHAEFGQRVNLYCERGQLMLTGRYHTFHRLDWIDADGKTYVQDAGAPPAGPGALGPYDAFGLHIPCLTAFVTAARSHAKSHAEPLATGVDGRAAVETSRAILRSAREGRPVTLASVTQGPAPEGIR